VSQSSSGIPGDGRSFNAVISADGQVVAFLSAAHNLAPGATPEAYHTFVRDRTAGTTQLADATWHGAGVDGNCPRPSLSADGRFVAFLSYASNIVPNDTNGHTVDLYVRDRALGTTRIASLTQAGAQPHRGVGNGSMSADGAWVVFDSSDPNIVSGDTNGVSD